MKNVLIISRGVPSEKYPLNGIFEFDQAKALKKHGLDVVLFILDFRSIRRIRRIGFFEDYKEGIKCFTLSFPLGNIEHPRFNDIARRITRLYLNVYKRRVGSPDVLHSHFVHISSLAVEFKRHFNAPLVVTEHSSLLNSDSISSNLFSLASETYQSSDLVIAVSSSLKARLKTIFNVNAVLVDNIVDNTIFQFDTAIKHFDKREEFKFVSVGTLNFNKGFDLLLEAFKLCNFEDRVKLKIMGDGELKKDLVQNVLDLALDRNVQLLGFQSRDQIFKEFEDADAFVLASRGETFGVVYIEALLSGLPVIATECGGPEDFIDESNGFLVPTENVSILSEALIKMVKSRTRFNSQEISTAAAARFAPAVIAERLSKLYLQLFNDRTDLPLSGEDVL